MGKNHRASGILLHITSLPSAFGIGDLGPWSYRFADLLEAKKQRSWSILPLSPTRLWDGNSPYQTSSAFAGNVLLISPERLIDVNLLSKERMSLTAKATSKVNFVNLYNQRELLLDEAFVNFRKTSMPQLDPMLSFNAFCTVNSKWLNDYALYTALRKKIGKPWYLWPPSLRKRQPEAIERKQQELKEAVEREKFGQYVFFSQWQNLKEHCRGKQISIVGDMPFYVAHDSVDVWVHPELFKLTITGKPRFVGGVPPDYFSSTGQLWGNPVYDWQKHEQTGFQWWMDRIKHNLNLYDKLRLDHFRGFVAYWQVPAKAKTAENGHWAKTPSNTFFEQLQSTFPSLPFIAEDLGMIDQPVEEAIQRLGIPGMKVLLFAFDDAKNPHLPKNHTENSVVYTGTHDTNTARGWFTSEASTKEKRFLFNTIEKRVSEKEVSLELVRLALASVADLSIVPLQDVLSLGEKARMNNPRHSKGNWEWRITQIQLASKNLDLLADLTEEFCRT